MARNSVDADTGQVGPELAELLGLPFAGGVRRLEPRADHLWLHCEHDDGWAQLEIRPPAVLSVAERLCEPAKVTSSVRSGGAARKVTDRGWMPRARQIGITGRSVAPRLYLGFGVSGKLNHTVGLRGAGTVLAVNSDPVAPIFASCDVGIVGDWAEVLPALTTAVQTLLEHSEMAPMSGQALRTAFQTDTISSDL